MNALAALSLFFSALLGAPAPVKLPVIADTSLQAHPSETTCNSGAVSGLRIKGNEHAMLMKFDLRPLAGWRVARATLWLHDAHPNMLRTVGLSTVATDWQEGTGRGEQATDGCTFTRAVWPDGMWAGPGSTFLDAALTGGNTIIRYADIQPQADGWFAVDVDPVLIHALLSGASYGLCLSDEKGQTRANNDVHSREQNSSAPYLMVEGEPTANLPALPTLGPIEAQSWAPAATFETGAIRLHVRSPGTFRYGIALTEGGGAEQVLPLVRTPRPLPAGQEQPLVIDGLKPGTAVVARVYGLDEFGRCTNVQAASAPTSAAKARPAPLMLTAMTPAPHQELLEGNDLRVWACPAECKVSPVTGAVLEEPTPGAFRRANPVWDSTEVQLEAARGEVLALQVVVENATPDVARQVTVEVRGEGPGAMPRPVGIYRNWYVRDKDGWFAEYMAPLTDTGGFALPAPDNAVPGQTNQTLTVVWEIPRDQPAGGLGTDLVFTVADHPGGDRKLPLVVLIHDFEVPARTSFEVDLNCYGPVKGEANWDAYLAAERQYFDAAHRLRSTLNSLGYSQSGKMSTGYAPEIAGEGAVVRAADWTKFDEHFGPYLDGSAFTGVRAGVPITHLYLPLHENWPTPIAGHYSAGNDLRKYPDNIAQHALTAPAVETAFDRTFADAFVAMTGQFADHFRQRGWTRTDLQCYLNDKYYYKDEKSGFRGTSWWLLDEPMHRDDWLALRYFAGLFRQGTGNADDAVARRLQFRGDISRPQWQRDWLDGLVGTMCVASALFENPAACRRFRDQGVALWHYGEANPIAASNLTAVAWALKAWCGGAEGILPWNSIGGDGAFTTPTPTALLIPGTRFGLTGPVVSLRLLALARGQQDVEYLNLLARRRGYDREQMQLLVAQALDLGGRQRQGYADDAGRVLFERLRPEDFAALRHAVAAALTAP